MKTNRLAMWIRGSGVILITAVVLSSRTMPVQADPGPPNTYCKDTGPQPRDARYHPDSCLVNTNSSSCNQPQWCIVTTLPDGWYCAPCDVGECTCNGNPTTYYVSDGYCAWGYGNEQNPRPNGECFCWYDEQHWWPVTAFDCSS